jgi:membrane associated rhomboid family serine protease
MAAADRQRGMMMNAGNSASPDHGPTRAAQFQQAEPPQPPHWTRRRLWALPVIVGLNVVVFLAWQFAVHGTELWAVLARNFLVSSHRLEQGMWWTLLTAAFSHMELWHLALNMIVLWSFGNVLERLLGVRVFVAFYLVAAVFSSASHCLVSSLVLGNDQIAALGASGAVSAVLLAFALLFPKHKILLFAVIPVPALAGALFFVALDLWGLIAQGQGAGLPIGHGAHLGGALCGALFYVTYLKGRFSRVPPAGHPRRQPTIELRPEEAAEFDRLRAKLNREGPDALTPKERAFMLDLRERALREPRDGQ